MCRELPLARALAGSLLTAICHCIFTDSEHNEIFMKAHGLINGPTVTGEPADLCIMQA